MVSKIFNRLKGCRTVGRTVLMAACLTSSPALLAQNDEPDWLRLQMDIRGDYQGEYLDGENVNNNSGFKGKYFLLRMSGNITDKFSYAYRQRLNKSSKDASFFDATDWLRLNYTPNKQWEFSAGKQVVAIGGYEYDRAPIDLYFTSEFWNQIRCFQWGASATYVLPKGNDRLTAQITTSPFDVSGENLYAYNLMWTGNHGCLSTLYSANMLEYLPGKFISYISLGHQVKWGDAMLQFDFMNRATDEHAFLFKNCSLVGELTYNFADRVNVFGKVSYDVNATRSAADQCVYAGTEVTRVGGGVEFFPIKGNPDIRLHGSVSHAFGRNTNSDGVVVDDQTFFNVGATWRINVIAAIKKIVKS